MDANQSNRAQRVIELIEGVANDWYINQEIEALVVELGGDLGTWRRLPTSHSGIYLALLMQRSAGG